MTGAGCNALCRPPRHVELLWAHPNFSDHPSAAGHIEDTLKRYFGFEHVVVQGRAELPPREDGWVAWTVEVEVESHEELWP